MFLRRGTERRAPLAAVSLTLFLSGCGGIIDKKAEQDFRARVGVVQVAVLPALLRGKTIAYDDASAAEIAKALNDRGLARAQVVTEHVPFDDGWRRNQAAMFRATAEALGGWVRSSSIESEYVLMPEYLGEGPYVGLHVYVVDRAGVMALGRLFNSHFREFRRARPSNPAEGAAFVVRYLDESLRRRD